MDVDVNKEEIMSPEQMRLEDHVKLLEAEIDKEVIEIDTQIDGGRTKSKENNNEESSIEDDVTITMQLQMAAEEENIVSLVEKDFSNKSCSTTKLDFRRLTSMFETQQSPLNMAKLPLPPKAVFVHCKQQPGTCLTAKEVISSSKPKPGTESMIKEGKIIHGRLSPNNSNIEDNSRHAETNEQESNPGRIATPTKTSVPISSTPKHSNRSDTSIQGPKSPLKHQASFIESKATRDSMPSTRCSTFAAEAMETGLKPASLQYLVADRLEVPNEYENVSGGLVSVVMVSICIDMDWLSSKVFPDSLNEEDELKFRIEQDGPFYAVIWWAILSNIIVKLACLNEALKVSDHGRSFRKAFFGRFSKFLVSRNVPEDLACAVKDKVITISWVELICALLSFGASLCIQFDFISSVALKDTQGDQILSLQGLLMVKGASGCVVFLSFVHHISQREFLSVIACSSTSHVVVLGLQPGNRRSQILEKVEDSLACMSVLKLGVDLIAGVFLWLKLVSIHRNVGFDVPKDVSTLISVIFSILVMSTVISPIHGVVMYWYIRLSKQRPSSWQHATAKHTPLSTQTKNSRMRYRRKPRSRPSSNNEMHAAGSLFDEELASTIQSCDDYELTQPTTSQNLFDSRLAMAGRSGSASSTLTKSNQMN